MPRSSSGNTPKHPPRGEVHGSYGSGDRSYRGGRERLGGANVTRASAAATGFLDCGGTDSLGGTTLWSRAPKVVLIGTDGDANGKRAGGLERGTAPHEDQGPVGENPKSVTGTGLARASVPRAAGTGEAGRYRGEQTVESVRNAEDGRWRAVESPRGPDPRLLKR